MPISSIAAMPTQVSVALAAIASTQSAELAVSTQLEQGMQMAMNPNLGQIVDLSA